MAADYFANNAEILRAMRSTFKFHRKQGKRKPLNSVKTIKVGVLAPITTFPAVVFLPQSERVVKWFSGNRATVERVYSVEVYSRNMDFDKGREQATMIMDNVVDVFQRDFTLASEDTGQVKQTYRIDLAPTSLAVDVEDRVPLTIVSVPVTFSSKEEINTVPDVAGSLVDNPTTESLVDTMLAQLGADRAVRLNGVRQILIAPSQLPTKFPAILISALGEETDKYEGGRNRIAHSFAFSVMYPMIPKEQALFTVMHLVEQLKWTLHTHSTWGNRCITSDITGIDYMRSGSEGAYLYEARVDYITQSVRVTEFGGA